MLTEALAGLTGPLQSEYANWIRLPLSYMCRPPRHAHHKRLPRAPQAISRMPARRSTHKIPKTANTYDALAKPYGHDDINKKLTHQWTEHKFKTIRFENLGRRIGANIEEKIVLGNQTAPAPIGSQSRLTVISILSRHKSTLRLMLRLRDEGLISRFDSVEHRLTSSESNPARTLQPTSEVTTTENMEA